MTVPLPLTLLTNLVGNYVCCDSLFPWFALVSSVRFTVFLPHLEKNHEGHLPFLPVISGAPLGSRASFLSEPHRPTSCPSLPTEVSRLFSVVTMQVWSALETAHSQFSGRVPSADARTVWSREEAVS